MTQPPTLLGRAAGAIGTVPIGGLHIADVIRAGSIKPARGCNDKEQESGSGAARRGPSGSSRRSSIIRPMTICIEAFGGSGSKISVGVTGGAMGKPG
jgi:hypothetical protein